MSAPVDCPHGVSTNALGACAACSATVVTDATTGLTGEPRGARGLSNAQLQPGTLLNGVWRIERALGRGGMGEVYAARDVQLERDVAVKVLTGADAEGTQGTARLLTEARAMARLDHPNLVPVYALGTHEGRDFIVMKLLQGTTFAEVRESPLPLASSELERWVADWCAGLSYLHERGLVHRDIKPSNLFVTHEGVGVILDFGIAEDLQAESSSERAGTPRYMPPEVAGADGVLEASADLFALSLVIAQALTGRSWWANELLERLTQEPPLLAEPWTRFLRRGVAAEPSARYRSAPELLHAFRVALRPVPPASPARTKWWVGASAAALMAAGGIAYFVRAAPAPAAAPAPVHPEPRESPVVDAVATSSPPVTVKEPVARRTTPVAAPVRSGSLRLVALDGKMLVWANVRIDGVPRGTAPVQLTLPAGPHEVVLEKDGYRPLVKRVVVHPGDAPPIRLQLSR